MKIMDKLNAGQQGEDLATRYLEKKGYQILARNFRYKRAEIDIIAQKDKLLAFVEVKARSSDVFGYPEEFVDEKKATLIIGAADHYIEKNQWEGLIRFDIISVMLRPRITLRHFEDAFY